MSEESLLVLWKPFKTMVKEYGEDLVMNKVMESLVEGERPDKIAKSLKIPFYEFMKWIHEDTKRLHGYHRAQELWAESLHSEVIEIADKATEDDVQVAKLRIKTRQEVAANYNRKRFGSVVIPDNKSFTGGITINITGVETPKFVEVVQERTQIGNERTQKENVPESTPDLVTEAILIKETL